MKMKTPKINQTQLSIFIVSILFTSCLKLDRDLKTGLDIETIAFPPKLAVFATLDGETGNFSLYIAEGRSLVDYSEPQYLGGKDLIRDGEIRLFENDRLILTESGPFDISYQLGGDFQDTDGSSSSLRQTVFEYHFEKSGISTRPGNVYRLEVEVDGYEMVTSEMTMPAAPVVSASMDTTVMILKRLERNSIMGEGFYKFIFLQGRHSVMLPNLASEVGCWPVSIKLTDPDPKVRNYFAFEIYQDGPQILFIPDRYNTGIGVSDISILRENPDLEARRGGLIDSDYADFYTFSSLLMSDRTFSGNNTSFCFYSAAQYTSDPSINDPFYHDNPDCEKVVAKRTTTLCIKHFPESTFKYYRGQALQRERVGFFTEPVTITGNIKNGYGYFSVFNAVSIQLLEFEYEYWKRIGQQKE